jgi:hypothetical protein
VTIPFNPTAPWMATVIGPELDDTVDQLAQVALTSLCGSRLTDTAAVPIDPPSDQDRELKVAYHRLSEAEHAWHYIHQQLDAAREMVDERTHAIIHLEYANEQQDLELEERAETIATLEQQLLELQLQAPPAPEDHDEADAMSGVDED